MTVRSTVLSLLCALALHCAFPLIGWWWIAPLACAGLTAAWCTLSPRRAALVGYASGMVFFSLGFSWFGETAGSLLGPAAPLLDLAPAAIESIAFALAATVTSLAARRCDVRLVPIVAAAAYTIAELLRSSGVLGVPLEQLGVALIDSPLRPLAAYAGVYGITFVTALLGAVLGWWLLDPRDLRRGATALAAWFAVVACTAAAWAFWPARFHAAPARHVAAVQGGIAQTLKMSSQGLQTGIARYLALTASLRTQTVKPTLVLWPETVITTVLDAPQNAGLMRRISSLSRELNATLVVGSLAQRPNGIANALFFFEPSGATAVYAKEQLVPFAEYVPGPAWLRSLPYADQIGIYAPGTNARETFDGGVTPMICWESLFTDIAHDRVAGDPSLYVISTDDAWFGTTEFPYEHAMAATVRAVETGRWVLRAGATGISGIVAPDGTWTQRTALGGPAIVTGDVGAPSPAPYAALGPTPITVALLLAAALPFVRRRSAA
ncbi:MAG TPA: apolipoprotein N-acyltransferase [Candidatus Elarobacter sp.]